MAIVGNKTRPRRLGRPADRKDEVVDYLRESIVSGEFKPGGRMPTREQIIRQFNASPMTVNNALTELREHGFVEVRGNQGTYVAGSLPHQTRYAIAFGVKKGETAGQGYTDSLAKECAQVRKTLVDNRELEIVPFYGLDAHWDSPDFIRLMGEVRAHRIAGIIAANNIPCVIEAEDIIANKVPIVFCGELKGQTHASSVHLDVDSCADVSLRYLAERGVKRPGFIFSVKDNFPYSSVWLERARRYGMTTEPFWIQMAHLQAPDAARRIAHLMMMPHGTYHPDGMIVADDNLVPYASQGLTDAGLTSWSNFPLVCHANFPWPTKCYLPALRVGYDLSEMIRVCVGIIDRMRTNGGVVEYQTVPAVSQLVESDGQDK